MSALCVLSAPIDDARRLYNQGDYEGALAALETLHRKTPRDGAVNYWMGATLMALDRTTEARKYFSTAADRGVADAALALARLDVEAYDASGAQDWYDEYTRLMRKNKRAVPAEVELEQSRLTLMENMMSRVESIQVIDSLVVDADRFFTHYRLSPEAGRLVPGEMARLPGVEVAFIPENNTEIIYSRPDSLGYFQLMSADILDDGTVDHPMPLAGDDLAGGGNAEYPFMLSDGLTLYYAADGEGSLGGYDIFLTRRDEDEGYLQPQNIGMPYNSPDDDYLLAIDETTGVGWWATDRNHIPGKVTIYIFIPSDSRVNVDTENPDLVALARLSDIKLTQRPGANYKPLLDAIAAVKPAGNSNSETARSAFVLPIGSDNLVYYNLSDFKSPQARQLMATALDARAGIQKTETRIEALRSTYRTGDYRVASDILDLEQQLDELRTKYRALCNQAISAELRQLRK